MKKLFSSLTSTDRATLNNARPTDMGFYHGYEIVPGGGGAAAISVTREFPGQNIIRAALERLGKK